MSRDLDYEDEFDELEFKHHSILPNSPLLMGIVGSSGKGKTFLTFLMLTDDENLLIYTLTPNQIEYRFLKGLEVLSKSTIRDLYLNYKKFKKENKEKNIKVIDVIEEAIQQNNKDRVYTSIKILISNKQSDFSIRNIDKEKKNLAIFDDCVTKDQSLQQDFFSSGRHQNIHSVFQSQTFFGMDKQIIRTNMNCYVLFELNPRDIKELMQSISHGMEPKDF